MGTSTSPNQLAGKLDKLATSMKDPTPALMAVAMEGKRTFLATAGSAKALGKVAGRRRAVGARFNVGRRGTSHAWALLMYTGPAHLINNPTRPHDIYPRRRPGVRTRSRRGARALTINGDIVASAHHPGTKGKKFFGKAKAIVEQEAPRTFAKEGLSKPLHEVFG